MTMRLYAEEQTTAKISESRAFSKSRLEIVQANLNSLHPTDVQVRPVLTTGRTTRVRHTVDSFVYAWDGGRIKVELFPTGILKETRYTVYDLAKVDLASGANMLKAREVLRELRESGYRLDHPPARWDPRYQRMDHRSLIF